MKLRKLLIIHICIYTYPTNTDINNKSIADDLKISIEQNLHIITN